MLKAFKNKNRKTNKNGPTQREWGEANINLFPGQG